MDLKGKNIILQKLRTEADEIRQWMYEHTSPDTSIREFEKMANRYAIIQTRMYIIDKQW